ncbi:MAG: MarP family serine protease [Actinomycetota bacterium]
MIDLVLLVVLIAVAVSGFRRGAVVGVLSVAGFFGGGALAMWVLPFIVEPPSAGDPSAARRAAVLLIGVLAVAVLGNVAAVAVGVKIRAQVQLLSIRIIDSVLGAVASVVAVCLLMWLIAGAVRGSSFDVLSRAVGGSRIVAAIDAVVPASSGRAFAQFRALVDDESFPRVFEGFSAEQIRPVPEPDGGVRSTAAVRAAADSVVKVTGDAVACSRAQEGTGWVWQPGLVVTNAHVVAGVREPEVQIGGVGRRYQGTVVVFDPVRDLAVIEVPQLPAQSLPLGSELTRGESAVVAGFPLNGPYKVGAARVRDVVTARGEDIYGRQPSTREVYSLYAEVQPGNSGGPVLDSRGRVVGVVFAKSLDDDQTGYALTLDESRPVLSEARTAESPVSTGQCVVS